MSVTPPDLPDAAETVSGPSARVLSALHAHYHATISSITPVHELKGGKSGAQVWLCDFARRADVTEQDAEPMLDGQYIVKYDELPSPGAVSDNDLRERLGQFAIDHIPSLRNSIFVDDVSIQIFDLAGASLLKVSAVADLYDYRDRSVIRSEAACQLLRAQLMSKVEVNYEATAQSLVSDWFGKKFPNTKRGNRIRESASESLHLDLSEAIFQFEGEQLPNPLAIFQSHLPELNQPLGCFTGFCHGDLHERNILARGSRLAAALEYWLIDFSWPDPAPLLYDQAYLEAGVLIAELANVRQPRLSVILAELDGRQPVIPASLDLPSVVLVDSIQNLRTSVFEVLVTQEGRRRDVWEQQLLLARVCAYLNWAGKPLDTIDQCGAAFICAAWCLREWLVAYKAELWETLIRKQATLRLPSSDDHKPLAAAPIAEALQLWSPFASVNSGLDLFLVAEPVALATEVSSLGDVSWSAVIDLDPRSDDDGLLNRIGKDIQQLRHVAIFGQNVQMTNPRRSTNWLMANGWSSRNEPTSQSSIDFRRAGFLRRARELVDAVADASLSNRAAVLVLRAADTDHAPADRILEYIDERYGGVAHVLTLGVADGIHIGEFFSAVRSSLSTDSKKSDATLPTGDGGQITLTRADLLRLDTDLEVLHSAVLLDDYSDNVQSDDFWRGKPPSWAELDANLDIQRDVHAETIAELEPLLDRNRLTVVPIAHSPGAGGTTFARRICWSLHHRYPTVRLRRFTESTVEFVDEIYQRTGRAVLVLAEAADLPGSDRDAFMDGLGQRNARAVVLWVRRTNRPQSASGIKLADPVSDRERRAFVAEYKRRARSELGAQMLEELLEGEIFDHPSQQMSPFYFGLCAYEEEFNGLDSFVSYHVSRLSDVQRSVARLIALASRYAQFQMPIDLVRRWLGAAHPATEYYSEDSLTSITGVNLRHMVVRSHNSLRMLHPLIAERILEDLDGASWSLAQVAVEFIKRLRETLGSSSWLARNMLSNLFIYRSFLGESAGARSSFSELILAMPIEGGQLVFETLTDLFPNEAHFWNHRGRFHIYRARGDYKKAEEFLERAVEVSQGRDATHLHTLGMVRRFWVEDELRSSLQARTPAEALMHEIRPRYDAAMQAFAECRPNMSGDHGLVTPIQLIRTAVDALIRASEVENLSELIVRGGAVASWIADQLGVAESLLDDLRGLYVEGADRSRYVDRLATDFDMLYGDFATLIARWREIRVAQDDESGHLGLVLARTIFAQRKRDWTDVSEVDAREIAEMLSDSVAAGTASSADLRLWVQAFRRLPEFSEANALERCNWYAERGSLDANYYLYVLNFLTWLRGDAQSQDRARVYLDECKRLGRLQRGRSWSYEWLGKAPSASSLVHFTELGRREPDSFWQRTGSLGRLQGVIERIDGPQAGQLRVDRGSLTAFFLPRLEYLRSRDINRVVEFYIGFSYDGLRAWELSDPGRSDAAT